MRQDTTKCNPFSPLGWAKAVMCLEIFLTTFYSVHMGIELVNSIWSRGKDLKAAGVTDEATLTAELSCAMAIAFGLILLFFYLAHGTIVLCEGIYRSSISSLHTWFLMRVALAIVLFAAILAHYLVLHKSCLGALVLDLYAFFSLNMVGDYKRQLQRQRLTRKIMTIPPAMRFVSPSYSFNKSGPAAERKFSIPEFNFAKKIQEVEAKKANAEGAQAAAKAAGVVISPDDRMV